MNRQYFNDIVQGHYGRKIAYADVNEITEENVVSVLGKTIGIFNTNKVAVRYLWDYHNGDQPILYRVKTGSRDDIVNKVVENHAWEIVRFKNAQTYGEPVQFVSLRKDDSISKAVDQLNDYARAAGKGLKDINSGEWTSAVGTGFKAIQRKSGDVPFRIVVPTPMNTYIIYSRRTEEPLASVQQLKDEDGNPYYQIFSPTREFIVQNSQLLPIDAFPDGTAVYSRLHVFGDIPIVEVPNNQSRISDVELTISLTDAINNLQSNRVDGVQQFVQSWIRFINCEIDEKTFQKMKMMGALVVKSNNGSDNKASVDVMTQELNQEQTQVAKQDMLDNILTIQAIPNREGKTNGGDTAGATALRNGWDFSKQAAKLKDQYVVAADKKLAMVMLDVIRVARKEQTRMLSELDFTVQINHSPTDNMYTKSESFKMLVEAGIHPLVAIETCGLWGDSEKVYQISKPYLDVLYKTVDEVVPDADQQRAQAQQILNNQTTQNTQDQVNDGSNNT